MSLDVCPPSLDQHLREAAPAALFVDTVTSISDTEIPWRIHVVRGTVGSRLRQLIRLYDPQLVVMGPACRRRGTRLGRIRRQLATSAVDVVATDVG
jgi:hypothetical protein